MRYLTVLSFLILIASPVSADLAGKPRVIDGDTIEIAGERIRLHGIDTPESKQTCLGENGNRWSCGQEATFALANMIGDHWITCKGDERDRYGRLIAVCYAGKIDLNAMMVQKGWALAYRQYSMDYVPEEDTARQNKQGLWRGQFIAPWKWRQGKRLSAEAQKICCKVCRKGKACGNSCIRRAYTCRKSQGCACDAN